MTKTFTVEIVRVSAGGSIRARCNRALIFRKSEESSIIDSRGANGTQMLDRVACSETEKRVNDAYKTLFGTNDIRRASIGSARSRLLQFSRLRCILTIHMWCKKMIIHDKSFFDWFYTLSRENRDVDLPSCWASSLWLLRWLLSPSLPRHS